MLHTVRAFFADRNVLEVETPALCRAVGTDPSLQFFATRYSGPGAQTGLDVYLQTSPEYAMKRLLAAGSGPIFQICKAFRDGESGRYHNPEFSILEWYRPGFTLAQLMDEAEALLRELLCPTGSLDAGERFSYATIFQTCTGIDPLTARVADFEACAAAHGLPEAREVCGSEKSIWLDFLFSCIVQPRLGRGCLSMVYDYPACQSALARLKKENPLVAERVEVFFEGVELGNGFRELTDADEQERRFDKDRAVRERFGLPVPEKDSRFLAALRAGLPQCSGIAIGLDRVLMLVCQASSIEDVLAFPLMRA